MATEDTGKSSETLFSNGILLAVIPAYLYLCSYQFERGMCKVYGIPTYLIKPDLSTNLYYFTILAILLAIIYIYPHFVVQNLFGDTFNKRPQLLPFLRANMIVVCIVLLNWVIFTIEQFEYIFFIFLFLLANFFALIQYLYLKDQLKTKGYNEIAEDWNRKVNMPYPVLEGTDVLNLRSLFGHVKEKHKIAITFFIVILVLSYFIGKKSASQKTRFEVLANNQQCVLLKKYGDD